MTFGEKLYRLRRERGMSQETLARALGVSRQAISRWELDEVIPDTANVLAVSQKFGVSTDYLLREDCSGDGAVPAAKEPVEPLKDRQYLVGCGIGYRFLTFAGLAVWHRNYGTPDATLLLPFTLGWTLLFGILLARTMVNVRKRDKEAAKRILRNDILCTCCICFLPTALREIPGNWEIFLSQMLMVSPLVQNWNRLRQVYQIPMPQKEERNEPPAGGSFSFPAYHGGGEGIPCVFCGTMTGWQRWNTPTAGPSAAIPDFTTTKI